jgi:hypothetical protein
VPLELLLLADLSGSSAAVLLVVVGGDDDDCLQETALKIENVDSNIEQTNI